MESWNRELSFTVSKPFACQSHTLQIIQLSYVVHRSAILNPIKLLFVCRRIFSFGKDEPLYFRLTQSFLPLYMAQQLQTCLDRIIVEVTNTIRHTRLVGLLWTNDWPVAEATTYITHYRHNRRMSVSLEGLDASDPSNQTTSDLLFTRYDHRDRLNSTFSDG